jgi:hypothetical protein
MSIQVLPHDLILEQVQLPKLKCENLSEEMLHVILVFVRECLHKVGQYRLLFLAELSKKSFFEDVREDLREV